MNSFDPLAPPTTGDGPPAYGQPGHQAGTAPLAGRGSRFAAALIDGLISIAITLPLQFKLGVYKDFPDMSSFGFGEKAAWGLGGFVLWTALHGYLLATRSQTIGKRLVGIQIVNVSDGRPTPFSRVLFARFFPVAVVSNIPFLGGLASLVDALFIFADDRRCLHDHIAGTKVVDYRAAHPTTEI
jgi:uncharacterized RDD family membrane protein YckC